MKKKQGGHLIYGNNGYKVVNQYLEVLTLYKYIELKLHFCFQKQKHPNKNNTTIYKKTDIRNPKELISYKKYS